MTQPPYGEPPQEPFAYPPPVDPFGTGQQPATPPPPGHPPPGPNYPPGPDYPPGPSYPGPSYPPGPGPGYPPPGTQPGYPPGPGYPPPATPPPGYPTSGFPASGYDPSTPYPPLPPTPPPPKKRRGLMITAIVFGVVLLLCAGGGIAAYFYLKDGGGKGADNATVAVNDFLVAVYSDHDATKAEKLVCPEARKKADLTKKIDEVKKYGEGYKAPKFSWPEPTVAEQKTDRAKVSVDVKVTTDDEKVAEQRLDFVVVKKDGWFVCEVQAGS